MTRLGLESFCLRETKLIPVSNILGKGFKLPELGEMIPALSTPEGGNNQDKMSQQI